MRISAALAIITAFTLPQASAHPQYPTERPPRETPAAAEANYTVRPDQLRQTIRGFGFEIQSDSIGSGNNGLPDAFTSVPHDLTAAEREQNEYEYLYGPTTPARCMNTVLHIMNWFQPGQAPSWYWIHALKPIANAEASGYSLGFWRPANDTKPDDDPRFPGLKPGHWTWNKYNWHAVGSFVRNMPWDCRAVAVNETVKDPDLRILAFRKPSGKLTVALANRSFTEHTFHVATGLENKTFSGRRYTPDNAGENMTWEFWDEQ
jgi:hypothetical protein